MDKSVIISDENYVIGKQFAEGGNSFVYDAKKAGSEEHFAIKVLKKANSDEKRKRFVKELEFCEQKDHPNILKVFGQGTFRNKPCYLMKKYSRNLRDVISEEINPMKLLRYAIQIAEAIEYVHSQNVIHRDIKPENIFVDGDCVVLADFGIAHFEDSTLTLAKDWLGNKSYAAPEQLIKGYAKNVTTACDIYALGEIMNELFTKEKPSGANYKKISMIAPALFPLDEIVFKCILQNPDDRPKIDEIVCELQLVYEELECALEEIAEDLLNSCECENTETENLARIAATDILFAEYILKYASDMELEDYNYSYHREIRYNLSQTLKNQFFQAETYSLCLKKFNYEANVYNCGNLYKPLDTEDLEGSKLYEAFKSIIEKYPSSPDLFDISGKTLKLFCSCCDYHCVELLKNLQMLESHMENLDNSPILYIVYKLRKVLDKDDIETLELRDYLLINWKTSDVELLSNNNFYVDKDDVEVEILEQFKSKWNIVYSKVNDNKYRVIFRKQDDYDRFKEYSLNLAKTYYVFEGDVEKLIEVNRVTESLVELNPLDSFDVTNVLAKLLGLREVE